MSSGFDFVHVRARGVVGYPELSHLSGEPVVIPCGSHGWIADTETTNLVASGSVTVSTSSCFPVTTDVIAGIPGSFVPEGAVPPNLQALIDTGVGSGLAWTVGQHVVLGDASTAYWNSSTWIVGTAP